MIGWVLCHLGLHRKRLEDSLYADRIFLARGVNLLECSRKGCTWATERKDERDASVPGAER